MNSTAMNDEGCPTCCIQQRWVLLNNAAYIWPNINTQNASVFLSSFLAAIYMKFSKVKLFL